MAVLCSAGGGYVFEMAAVIHLAAASELAAVSERAVAIQPYP
jgi:hypothetical protein